MARKAPSPQKWATIDIAPRGFATSFPKSETPREYSLQFKNMFANSVGAAEKRPGIAETTSRIPNHINVSNLHELVTAEGVTLLFATGLGEIHLYDSVADTWTSVHTFATRSAKIYSMYMLGKIIFYNGTDRNIYTKEGTTFYEMLSILEAGVAVCASPSALVDETHLADISAVPNWTLSNVAQFSVVYYPAVSAYAMVTDVCADQLKHTAVCALGDGIGVGSVPTSGSAYTIIDTLAINIIPTSGAGFIDLDNKGVLTSGSNSTTVRIGLVSAFSSTEIRKDDFVYNQTQNKLTQVSDITTSSLSTVALSGQTVGDTVYLLKSSMPITKHGVTHFQRAFMVDSRNQQKIRITGPNNPHDFGGDLATTMDISTLQPESDNILALHTFQRFFTIACSKHIYFYEGTDPSPVSAAAAGAVDFNQSGMFPFGILSTDGIINVGNDVYFATNNGVRKATLSKISSQFIDNTVSIQIDKTLRDLLRSLPAADIQMFHYPRRSWVVLKAGSELFVFNYISEENVSTESTMFDDRYTTNGAWHLFDGPFATQLTYLLRENGDLWTGDTNGKVCLYDNNVYSDLGQPIPTLYETGWLSLERTPSTPNRKQGKSIRPLLEAGVSTPVTIRVDAPYRLSSSDTITVTAAAAAAAIGQATIGTWIIGGSNVTSLKHPLRWSGEMVKFRFSTETTTGPFLMSNFTIFYSQDGPE